jgi:hypothetical protein
MEIKLQAYKNYGIADWDGTVEIFGLHLYQSKRVANSRNLGSLFRKLLKVYKSGDRSPVKLPAEFDAENLDLGDFMQIAIGISVLSGGKEFQQNITCGYCKALNPRVINRLDVFVPEKPKVEGGKQEISIIASTNGKREAKNEKMDKKQLKVLCNYTSVRRYLNVYERTENLSFDEARKSEFYSSIIPVEDADDFDDLKKIIMDVGIVAEVAEIEGLETFEERLKWLCYLQGEQQTKDFGKISEVISDLGTDIKREYKTQCIKCGKELVRDLSPTEYFFDMG